MGLFKILCSESWSENFKKNENWDFSKSDRLNNWKYFLMLMKNWFYVIYECKMVKPFIIQMLKGTWMQMSWMLMQKLLLMLIMKDDAWMYEEWRWMQWTIHIKFKPMHWMIKWVRK